MADFAFEIVPVGRRKLACLPAEGTVLMREADALELIEGVSHAEVSHVVVPKARISPVFLDLSNGILASMAQKFGTAHLTLVLVGDFANEAKNNPALRMFIREANQRKQPLFVGSMDGVIALLG